MINVILPFRINLHIWQVYVSWCLYDIPNGVVVTFPLQVLTASPKPHNLLLQPLLLPVWKRQCHKMTNGGFSCERLCQKQVECTWIIFQYFCSIKWHPNLRASFLMKARYGGCVFVVVVVLYFKCDQYLTLTLVVVVLYIISCYVG